MHGEGRKSLCVAFHAGCHGRSRVTNVSASLGCVGDRQDRGGQASMALMCEVRRSKWGGGEAGDGKRDAERFRSTQIYTNKSPAWNIYLVVLAISVRSHLLVPKQNTKQY